MSNLLGPLLLGFFIHWGNLVGARVCANPVHHIGSPGDPFSGPLSSILAATEGIHVDEAHSDGGPQHLRSPGFHEGETHAADVVKALEGAKGGSGQQQQPRGSGKHLTILLYVSLTAIFLTLVGICFFFWLRRLRSPKAAAAVPEQGIPHRFLIGRWGRNPHSVRRSSSSSSNSNGSFMGEGRRAPLYPSCPEGPGELCASHFAAEEVKILRGSLGAKLGHRKFGGPGPPNSSPLDGSIKGPPLPGERGIATVAESPTTALTQRADYEGPAGCGDGLSWQPAQLQQQILGGDLSSDRGDAFGVPCSPTCLSRVPISCRTSASAAAAAAIDMPTTFTVATPCSGGPRELLHWGAPIDGGGGGAPEETDLSVFASLPGEVPNTQGY